MKLVRNKLSGRLSKKRCLAYLGCKDATLIHQVEPVLKERLVNAHRNRDDELAQLLSQIRIRLRQTMYRLCGKCKAIITPKARFCSAHASHHPFFVPVLLSLLTGCSLVKEPAWMQTQVDKHERLKLKTVATANKSNGQIQVGDGSFSGTADLRYTTESIGIADPRRVVTGPIGLAGPEKVSTIPPTAPLSRYEWAMALRAPAIVPATYSCKFNWTPPNPPAATQRLYWDVVRGGRARVINLAGSTTNFNMKNLTNGTTYFIEVVSVNGQGRESTNTCAGSFIWEFKR